MVTGLLGITVPYVPTHALNVWTAIFAPLLFIGLSYPVLSESGRGTGQVARSSETYSKLRMVWKACTTLYPERVRATRRRRHRVHELYSSFAGNDARRVSIEPSGTVRRGRTFGKWYNPFQTMRSFEYVSR